MHSVVWLLAAGLALAPAAHAAQGVDLTLVLVSDVSRSIDDSEFKLEKDGYATAFTSKQVAAPSVQSRFPMSNSHPASRCAPSWTGR